MISAIRTHLVILMTIAIASTIAEASVLQASVREMEGSLLKGNGRAALEIAARAKNLGSSGPALDYVRCVVGRLSTAPVLDQSLDVFVSRTLLLYQRYWYESLLDPAREAENEAQLGHSLRELLSSSVNNGFEAVEMELSKELTERGYFVLLGRTPPLRELMIWKAQRSRIFNVALPEGRHTSQVFLLEDFKSFGWASWATCEHRATGGWATNAALFAPLPRYRSGIEGNEFQAVFLAHEAQHLSDKQQLKELQPWELEYRAKLAELWAADEVVLADRLGKFEDSQSGDPGLAHSYANKKVIADLQSYLSRPPSSVSVGEIHEAAKRLLRADSERRGATDSNTGHAAPE